MLRRIVLSVAALVMMVFFGCGTTQGPSTPTGVTITTPPNTLSWSAASGASSYIVYRGTTSGTIVAKSLLAAGIAATSYADASTVAGTTYYYQVTALNDNGQSSPSAEVSVRTSFSVAGSVDSTAPRNTITWGTVPNASSYNVYRSSGTSPVDTSGTPLGTVTATVATSYTYPDSSVTIGTTYNYQVVAVYPAGTLDLVSNQISLTP